MPLRRYIDVDLEGKTFSIDLAEGDQPRRVLLYNSTGSSSIIYAVSSSRLLFRAHYRKL